MTESDGQQDLSEELNLPFDLYPYQGEGVTFLVQNESALLADEMGLGKTVQTIVALRILMESRLCRRCLVVTPRALRRNWEKEFGVWAPDLLVRLVQGNVRNRQAFYHLPIPVLIATYGQVLNDSEHFDMDDEFGVVILDEAQRIKNRSTKTSMACRGICRRRSWALTGTPVENSSEEMVSIFSFVNRDLIYDGMSVGEMHSRIKPFFLRRTKEEALPDLPPIINQDLELELGGQQLASYQEQWNSRADFVRGKRAQVRGRMLALITQLKQTCNYDPDSGESAKLDALNLILQNFSSPADKILVFSQYVKTLRWLSGQISPFPHQIFHGGQNDAEREVAIDWFREEEGPCALLMSLKAGGVGLNLQEASTVVLFDRWWNPAVEDQAVQRAHRFGRERVLHAIRFITKNSIEERIDDLLREKKIIFEEYVGGAENADVATLSGENIWRILDLSAREVEEEEPS